MSDKKNKKGNPTQEPVAPPVPSRKKTRLQEQIENARLEHQKALYRQRMEIAREGLKNFSTNKVPEAVKSFHTYLAILENWKGVPEGGLTPSLFDVKKDHNELLLISGIYWDLVKLYDRTTSKSKNQEFLLYMEKFILFSKGLPHQPLMAQTVRRYMSMERPSHRSEFKNAYRMLGGETFCFIVNELSDFCHPKTLPRLRRFRDGVLRSRKSGRVFIGWYYANGKKFASLLKNLPKPIRVPVRWSVARALDGFAWSLNLMQNRSEAVRPECQLGVREVNPQR